MAYDSYLSKVYTSVKNLKPGQSVNMNKATAKKHGFENVEDIAEWAARANNNIVVRYLAKGSLYSIYSKEDSLARLRKSMLICRYNIAYSTICTEQQVQEVYKSLALSAKLVIWTGLATYYRLEK